MTSLDMAASLEATAKEIAAAAALYQRLPAERGKLAGALGSLTDRYKLEWAFFITKAATESLNVPR